MQSIAEMFAADLAELQRLDEESNRKTQETIKRCRELIKQFEAIDLETEY